MQILDDTEKSYSLIESAPVVLDVAKATDPGGTWTNQDTSNNPTNEVIRVEAVDEDSDFNQLGALFMASAFEQVNGMDFDLVADLHVFDLATDTWVIVDEQIDLNTGGFNNETDALATCFASVMVCGDGQLVALYAGAPEPDMGSDFDRVELATKSGSTWTLRGLAHTVPTAGEDWHGGTIVAGSANRAHCFLFNSTNFDGFSRTWRTSSNDFETMPSAGDATMDTDTNIHHAWGGGASYDDGATRRVRCPYIDADDKVSVAKLDSGDSPGAFTSDTGVSDTVADSIGNRGVKVALAADGTDLHVVFTQTSGTDRLTHDVNPDDAGWGTDDNPFNIVFTASEPQSISANVFTRNGTKRLAVLVMGGTNQRYDEYDLEVAADASLVIPNRFVRRFPHLRM
jgi:hypothetical protein